MTPYHEDGGIRRYLGDCRAVLPTLPPVDHVITDPPYARDVYLRGQHPRTKAGSRTPGRTGVALAKLAAGDIGTIDELLDPVAAEIARLAARWVLVFSDAESTGRWREALEAAGLRYVRTGAWVKPDAMPQMSGDRPAVGFEPATICHAQGKMRWNGGGRAAVWTHGVTRTARPDHPCPKPEPLMRELLGLFTDPDDVVLDPFAGSGTTLVSAARLGRQAIGIEADERFCEVAATRLQQRALPWGQP